MADPIFNPPKYNSIDDLVNDYIEYYTKNFQVIATETDDVYNKLMAYETVLVRDTLMVETNGPSVYDIKLINAINNIKRSKISAISASYTILINEILHIYKNRK